MKTTSKYFYILLSIIILGVALSYAAVPLYKIYCQTTGYGGTTKQEKNIVLDYNTSEKIKIRFESQIDNNIPLKFKPSQKEVITHIGESSLAFYSVINDSDSEVYGIATYNVTPNKTGKYFTKIQCFCFEEQRCKPHEQVEMPILFYIDPSIKEDESCKNVTEITLSYTLYQIDE